MVAELFMFPDLKHSLYCLNITHCAYMDLQYNAWFDLQALCMSGYSHIQ